MTNIQKALSELKNGEALKINPEGTSMCPCFLGGRDTVFIIPSVFPLKRGEIALFQRADGTYVVHRVYKVKENKYFFLGDNQWFIEGPIEEKDIHGKVVQLLRKEKLIDCDNNPKYKFWTKLWLILRPVRPLFIWIWNHVKRA